jgi:hypothetical protein
VKANRCDGVIIPACAAAWIWLHRDATSLPLDFPLALLLAIGCRHLTRRRHRQAGARARRPAGVPADAHAHEAGQAVDGSASAERFDSAARAARSYRKGGGRKPSSLASRTSDVEPSPDRETPCA